MVRRQAFDFYFAEKLECYNSIRFSDDGDVIEFAVILGEGVWSAFGDTKRVVANTLNCCRDAFESSPVASIVTRALLIRHVRSLCELGEEIKAKRRERAFQMGGGVRLSANLSLVMCMMPASIAFMRESEHPGRRYFASSDIVAHLRTFIEVDGDHAAMH
jgi:hypothetical protein